MGTISKQEEGSLTKHEKHMLGYTVILILSGAGYFLMFNNPSSPPSPPRIFLRESNPAPPLISRVITYPLEGNWEINAPARLKKSDGSIFQRVYNFRLIVQKDPPNSGAVILKDFPFRIVGLTKEGNKFTIQTEAIIFGGVISLQGRIISNNSMEGSCKLSGAITEGYDWIITNFTGRRVEYFDLKK